MWQNKITSLWEAIKSANPSDSICEQGILKTYADLISDLNKLDALIGSNTQLKIALYMEKSYFSMVSVLFCLLKGNCFIPVFSNSKSAFEIISSISPDFIFSTEDSTAFKERTVNITRLLENPISATSKNFEPAALVPSEIAYVISTSGTTGKPKLIPISFKNFNSYLENIYPVINNKNRFFLLQNFEISFDPYLFDLVAVISSGSCLLPIKHADLRNINNILSSLRGDIWTSLTPSQGDLVLSLISGKRNTSLKRTYFLGEKLKTSLCQDWLGTFPETEIYNMYGPAELTVSVFYHKFEVEKDKTAYVPIGKIHSGHEFKINDSNELIVKGPQLFSGYIGAPSTEEWFNTHDIVSLNNSEIFVTGRSDMQVKINGRRFQPEEIEVVLTISGISGYVVPVTVEEKNKSKTYLVFVTQNRSIEVAEILKILQPKFDVDLIPKRVLFVDKIPMSQNGKINRKQLALDISKSESIQKT